jgi:hypothetical protein
VRTHRPAAEATAAPARALAAPGRGAAVLAGAVAGVAFLAVEAASAGALTGEGPRAVLRHLAAAAAPGEASAGALVLALAAVTTIAVAAAYGALVALAARRFTGAAAWWSGVASGLTVYVVNFHYLLAPTLRWLGEVRDQVSVLSPWYLVTLWP